MIELLKQVKTVITHADCPDGLASAMILHDALPDARVLFVNYGKPERENMPAEPGQLWCDIIPPEARVQEFVDAGAIVLDHHKGAEDIVRLFGERGVFAHETREPGVSGAVLAFREVWEPLRRREFPPFPGQMFQGPPTQETAAKLMDWYTEPSVVSSVADFATLAGIRDTWQKSHPRWREALVAYHALTLHDWEHWKTRPPYLTKDDLAVGEALLKKRERDVEKCARDAWIGPVSVERLGFRVLPPENRVDVTRIALAIVNSPYELASDVSDFLRERHGVDLILAFRYEARGEDQVLRVSARSGPRYDAQVLAAAHGGGGHTRAAGFELRGRAPEPFELLRKLVREAPQPGRA